MADKPVEKKKKEKDEVVTIVGIPQDVFAWGLGIGFIVALVIAIMVFGRVRHWDAQSGFTHNISETSAERFLPEPTGEEDVPGRCGPTASGRWYYWQLPPDETTAWTDAFVWLCYVAHQLFIWATIYIAQRKRARGEMTGLKYSNRMTQYQWIPLFVNMGFHLLHLVQTHWTYDATAQHVSEASSQSSVIMLLVFVLLMEYRDRGLFFGWPSIHHKGKVSKALRLQQGPTNMMRKYHGYAFAWGAIYTFWYHPMENTWGHCMGFIHTWLLMLQGSLMYTNIHLNRYWRLLLESWVTIHATVVAVQTGGPGLELWPMFCFGFLWLFFMTQLFGLPFWKKIPGWTKSLPFLVFFSVTLGLYGFYFEDSQGRHWIRLNELIRIPFIEYMAVLWSWLCLWIFLKIEQFIQSKSSADTSEPIGQVTEVLYIFICLFIYAFLVVFSFLIQELDFKMDLTALMIMLVLIFIILVCVTVLLLKQIMRPIRTNKVVPSLAHGVISEEKSIKMNDNQKDNGSFQGESNTSS